MSDEKKPLRVRIAEAKGWKVDGKPDCWRGPDGSHRHILPPYGETWDATGELLEELVYFNIVNVVAPAHLEAAFNSNQGPLMDGPPALWTVVATNAPPVIHHDVTLCATIGKAWLAWKTAMRTYSAAAEAAAAERRVFFK